MDQVRIVLDEMYHKNKKKLIKKLKYETQANLENMKFHHSVCYLYNIKHFK